MLIHDKIHSMYKLYLLIFSILGLSVTSNAQDSTLVEYFKKLDKEVLKAGLITEKMKIFECDIDSLVMNYHVCSKSLKEIFPIAKGEDTLEYSINDTVSLVLTKQKFIKNNNKIELHKSYVTYINDSVKFGSKLEIPETVFGSIKLIGDSEINSVPANDLNNLFNPNFYFQTLQRDVPGDVRVFFGNEKIIVSVLGGDGGSAYQFICCFDSYKYIGRCIFIP